jgi:hypothetical protein
MDILENKAEWQKEFRRGWLAKLRQEGAIDWSLYPDLRNEKSPGAPGIVLRRGKLLFITSSGAYLRGRQRPFDEPNPLGDYTIRTFPITVKFADLAYAHGHYDTAMVEMDPQVALPLRHLQELVAAGQLGSLTSEVISFMGYEPDCGRVVNEVAPAIAEAAQALEANAALLAPL